MIRSRVGLKTLGLCAMLIGMLAFASVAQAEPGAFWLVNGAKISESLLPTVQAEKDTALSLLTTLGGKEIHIRCANIKFIGMHLVEPLGKMLGKIDLSGCKFFRLITVFEEVEQKSCEPIAEGVKGLIVSNNITSLIKLHEASAGVRESVLEAVPTEGTLFASMILGEECAFGETLKIGQGKDGSGKTLPSAFFLKDCQGKALTDLVKHLVEELPALTRMYINGGATPVRLNGSAWMFLDGAHKGLTFAAHAA